MDLSELRQVILYGSLPIEIDFSLYTFPEQLEIIRYIVAKPSSISRIRTNNVVDTRTSTLLRYMNLIT